jgi:hypothetical protein
VQVLPGGIDCCAGVFGSRAITEFVAHRDNAAGVAVPRALFGSWRLNVGRSTFNPGPAPVFNSSEVVSYVSRPGGEVVTAVVGVVAAGYPSISFGSGRADGRDYPVYDATSLAAFVTSGTPTTLTRALTPLGKNGYDVVFKTNGTVTSRRRMSVSADRRVLTIVQTVLNAAGEPTATNTLLYDRLTSLTARPPTN